MQQHKESPKDLELAKNVKRAITTTFIGAIAELEKNIGYLWGHGKTELTENEKKWLAVWENVRNNILDIGNGQCRIMDREFEKYNVKYVGKFTVFKIKQPYVNGNRI